jgi:hypothetical protein
MKYPNLEMGTIEAVFNKLGGFYAAKAFLRGEMELKQLDQVIDLDKITVNRRDYDVMEHQKGGRLTWSPAAVELYVDVLQVSKRATGHDIRKILADKPVLNICAMEFLLERQHLIPEEWKGKAIFFWGTIFRGYEGRPYVMCMRMWHGEWAWSAHPLNNPWGTNSPAILRAT